MLRPKLVLPDPGATFWASLRYFTLTRLIITAVLLGAAIYGSDRPYIGERAPVLFARVTIMYAAAALIFAYLASLKRRRFYFQLNVQLLIDIIVLTILNDASGGVRSGLTMLYLLPVAGAAILSPASLAMMFAAFAAFSIIAGSAWRDLSFELGSPSFVQACLYGASCIAIAWVMNRLAAKLISQEQIALQRGQDLRAQIEINRIVVADMQDGVLILSDDGQPRSLNPAAIRLLHIQDISALIHYGWQNHAAGNAIRRQFLDWRGAMNQIDSSFELMVYAPGPSQPSDASGLASSDVLKGNGERVQARFIATIEQAIGGGQVVFLEELARVEELAQQLKLASMGRLTASIAHEIRNPLAAISHAAALLIEETASEARVALPDAKANKRLLGIVQENARRLNRIVENILQLSRRGAVQFELVDLNTHLQDILEEFCRDYDVAADIIALHLPKPMVMRFNGEHLRQVVINLLQNGLRYASLQPGCIRVGAQSVKPFKGPLNVALMGRSNAQFYGERLELFVEDDGPGVDPETRSHLFEPFFTTHHRGTGLGLYLARELCMANGAVLSFVPKTEESAKGAFVINAAGG